MNIGISNIALGGHSFLKALDIIKPLPIKGIEIAPTLLWKNSPRVPKKEREDVKKILADRGITAIGFQSLVYNHPELQLFGGSSTREMLEWHIKNLIELCNGIGGTILVFGAGKNRKKGNLSFDEALSSAATFFYKIAQECKEAGISICIEPLSGEYDCDFVNTADEGARLVQLVNHPHFKLLLDTGSMTMNKESCPDMIVRHADILGHMHINDPHLCAPGYKGVDHLSFAQALRQINYKGWLSLEFLLKGSSLEEEVAYALKCYGS
ncbi:MAG TPA: sugar phosphate isomerase/epimerase family protein [Candidatus Omnitrophota bacterium]|nr:sugar phosphate isomerase/epimerase family protein [Candidatus Omnitrophota bacterium]HPD84877.1 sugar phosphate isomerase/epimerase family protein [Candidatus Omnitrophota bacterium]HRZ03735.1 sugar phosphate isomerase/epimerase family protein [Candidatus Omnitrophota bacterium]